MKHSILGRLIKLSSDWKLLFLFFIQLWEQWTGSSSFCAAFRSVDWRETNLKTLKFYYIEQATCLVIFVMVVTDIKDVIVIVNQEIYSAALMVFDRGGSPSQRRGNSRSIRQHVTFHLWLVFFSLLGFLLAPKMLSLLFNIFLTSRLKSTSCFIVHHLMIQRLYF